MSNLLRPHIPNFAYNGEDKKSWEFNTLEELLELEWVTRFKEDKKSFMLSENKLMIVSDAGDWWWVVGYLKDKVDLPEWKELLNENE